MKKLSLICALALASSGLFAQENNTTSKKVGFSVGVELASPVGDLKDSHKFGIGGTAQVEYMVAQQVGITLNAGYISYSGKSQTFLGTTYKNPALGQIPILAGVRYYFIKDIYVSGQLGVSVFKVKGADSESAFTYAPGIGIKVSLLDLTLKYMGASKNGSTLSNVGLRVAVNF